MNKIRSNKSDIEMQDELSRSRYRVTYFSVLGIIRAYMQPTGGRRRGLKLIYHEMRKSCTTRL